MARGIDIEDFSEKLKLAMDRANLSRAALAQALGMDKSVVARWLLGSGRPADHSLSSLSALIGRHVEGFSRADWDAGLADFAARLGVLAPRAAAPPRIAPALAADASRPGSLPYFLGEAAAWTARHGLDEAAERFAGLWLLFWKNYNYEGQIGAITGEIFQAPAAEGGGLEMRWHNGASGPGQLGRRGPAFATGHMLFAVNGAPLRNHTFGAMCLLGTERRCAIMDGVMMHPVGPRADRAMSTRVLVLRLAPPAPDWATSERRYWAAGHHVEALNEEGWEERFPAVLRPVFDPLAGSNAVLVKPDDNPFLLAEQDVMARGAGPHRAALRDALLAMRALFSGVLAPG